VLCLNKIMTQEAKENTRSVVFVCTHILQNSGLVCFLFDFNFCV
jgi:hypothetical protein